MNLELDEYAHLNSLLHRWHPTLKLVGLVGLIFAFAGVKDWYLVPIMLGLTACLYGLSQLPLSFLLQRLRYPGYFLLGIVILLPFLSGQTVLWQWGWLTLRSEGLAAMFVVASRFLSILTVSFILIGTTPFLSLIKAMRSLGLPVVLTDMTLLSYRYLHDIANNLATMQQAMRLRGFGRSRQRPRFLRLDREDLRRSAFLAGTLLVRSYEQADRVYAAMRLRGYGQQLQRQTLRCPGFQTRRDRWHWSALGVMLLVAIGFFIMEWM